MRIVVIVPTGPPSHVRWVNHIFTLGRLGMAIGKHQVGPPVMPVGGPLCRRLRIHVAVETAVRLAVRQHDHIGRAFDLGALDLAHNVHVTTHAELALRQRRPGIAQTPVVIPDGKSGPLTDAVKIKRLEEVTYDQIAQSFQREDLIIYTNPADFKNFLFGQNFENSALLLMSSGNYGGLDFDEVKQLIK